MKLYLSLALILISMNAQARTLDETLAIATKHPIVEARAERVNEASGLLEAAKGTRYPTLVGEGVLGGQFYNQENLDGTAAIAGANLILNQYILDGGRRRANIASAESRLDERIYNLDDQRREQAYQAARSHIAVWLSQELARTNLANVQALETIVSSTVSRFKQSEATTTEVAEARSRLFGAIAVQAQRETQLKIARATYTEVVGESLAISDTAADPGTPPVMASGTVTHPLLAAAQKRLAEAQSIAAGREAGYWPTLDLNGSVSHNGFEGTNRDEHSTLGRLTLNLRYAFTDGGVVAAESRGANAAVRAAQADLQTVNLQLNASRQSASARLSKSAERLKASEDALAESTKTVDALLKEVRMGNRTLRELLDARRDELSATNDWLESYAAHALAGYEIKRWY